MLIGGVPGKSRPTAATEAWDEFHGFRGAECAFRGDDVQAGLGLERNRVEKDAAARGADRDRTERGLVGLDEPEQLVVRKIEKSGRGRHGRGSGGKRRAGFGRGVHLGGRKTGDQAADDSEPEPDPQAEVDHGSATRPF